MKRGRPRHPNQNKRLVVRHLAKQLRYAQQQAAAADKYETRLRSEGRASAYAKAIQLIRGMN